MNTAKKAQEFELVENKPEPNIYARLSQVRSEFHSSEIKKTGHNKFNDSRYFTQADILDTGLPLLAKHDLISLVSFTTEYATLTLHSTTDDTTIVFTSPMSTASLKGCHDVQNLGAVQTYETRYLYIQLFQVVENDVLEDTKATPKAAMATPEQLAILHDYADTDLMTSGQKSWIEKAGEKITEEQAAYVIEKLKEKESK